MAATRGRSLARSAPTTPTPSELLKGGRLLVQNVALLTSSITVTTVLIHWPIHGHKAILVSIGTSTSTSSSAAVGSIIVVSRGSSGERLASDG